MPRTHGSRAFVERPRSSTGHRLGPWIALLRNMRSLVVIAVLTAQPALACPPGARCVTDAPPVAEVPAPKRPVSLRVERVATQTPWKLEQAPVRAPESDMPWIWQVLRREVMSAMPRYRDRDLTFVLSPVVVTGSFDTVPGVGIAGDF